MGGAGPGEASLEGGRLDQAAPQQLGEAVAVLAVAPAEEALAVAPQGSEPAGAWVGTFPRRLVTSLGEAPSEAPQGLSAVSGGAGEGNPAAIADSAGGSATAPRGEERTRGGRACVCEGECRLAPLSQCGGGHCSTWAGLVIGLPRGP